MTNNNLIRNYPELRDKKILNVDDNDLNRLVISKILHDAGACIENAASGREAIQKLSDGLKPDIVLMDLEMPGMNGFQTSEYIRKNISLHLPIIINSGLVTGFDKYKLKKLNINEYLEKPYGMEDIFSKIVRNLPQLQAAS